MSEIFEEIEYGSQRNLDKNLLLRLADLSFITRSENVVITGATGCGKSFIATALGYQACQMGMRVGYYSLAKLLQKLHLAKADGSYAKELSKLERWQLLILDDWGLQALNLNARMAILQIIEDRHGKHSTIITYQLPVAKWYDYIGEPTLADAILDRILHQTHRIELKGESMRKRKNLSQKTANSLSLSRLATYPQAAHFQTVPLAQLQRYSHVALVRFIVTISNLAKVGLTFADIF